jgi:hypothetical protein
MVNIIRIKKRAAGGASGAPASLKSAEPAYNEQDDVLYYGKGDDGSANATSIIPIGGKGAFADLNSSQTIAGIKTFSSFMVTPSSAPTADYQVANKKYVDDSVTGGSVADGDKGDITVSGSGATWTIDNGAVSYAKIQNISATSRVLGRITSGAGVVEELTGANLRTIANVEDGADVTDAANVGASIHGATAKTTPVDADAFPLIDSAASNVLKKVTGTNLKAFLKTYFDTIYQAVGTYLTASSTATLTNKTFDANGTGNSISNIEVADFASGVIDTDTALAANSDSKIPTQKAVKAYADGLIAANDAMVFRGVIDCSANPNYPAANAGDTYRVSVAGKIGGASGPNVEAGDILLCITDGTASGNQATVGSNWSIIQTNIDGAVTLTGTQTLTNKTLTSPIFDGTPTAPTASAGTNTTQVATTANVVATIAAATIDGGTF